MAAGKRLAGAKPESKSPAGAVEDASTVGVTTDPAPAVAAEPKVARYTPDGILLNPEDFTVGSDGVLIPKAR